MAGGPTRSGSSCTAARLAGDQAGAYVRRIEPVAALLVAPPMQDVLPAPHPAPVPGRMWDPRIVVDNMVIAHRVRPGRHGGHDWCWHLRKGAKSAFMDHVSGYLVGALAPFGIRTIDRHTIEVPDALALNGLLQAMGRPPLYYGSSGRVSTECYVRGLADGLLPVGAKAIFFFHDLGDHVGALFFPPECLAILSGKIRILLAMTEDQQLPPEFQSVALSQTEFLAERLHFLIDLAYFPLRAWDDATEDRWKGRFTEVLGQHSFPEFSVSSLARTTSDVAARVRAYVDQFNAACATPEQCVALMSQTLDQATNGPFELRR